MKKMLIAIFVAMLVTPAVACNSGDILVEVIAPFDLYNQPGEFMPGRHGNLVEGAEELISHFPSGGVVCIDRGQNLYYQPSIKWSFIYFKVGIRDYAGAARVSSFKID